MNQFLAELYGTADNIGATDDVEKLAQAEVVNQMIQAEGLSVDDVDADTILKVAEHLFGADNELAKVAQEGGEEPSEAPAKEKKEKKEEEEEEAAEKMAEADFIGRMMAHAMVDELGSIEKEAGAKEKAMGALKKVLETGAYGVGRAAGAGKKSLEFIKAHPKASVGVGGGLLAAGGGLAAYKGLKGKKKKASAALDALAEERALAILKEAGYQVEDPDQTKLAEAVEARAYEMLAEAGLIEG